MKNIFNTIAQAPGFFYETGSKFEAQAAQNTGAKKAFYYASALSCTAGLIVLGIPCAIATVGAMGIAGIAQKFKGKNPPSP